MKMNSRIDTECTEEEEEGEEDTIENDDDFDINGLLYDTREKSQFEKYLFSVGSRDRLED